MYYKLNDDYSFSPLENYETFYEHKKVLFADTIGDYYISTIFLCLDHGFVKPNIPILFETMIFLNTGKDIFKLDQYQRRYNSYNKAKKAHFTIKKALIRRYERYKKI